MNTPNFSDIYTLYFEDVYKYLLALCHDEELAEELAQDRNGNITGLKQMEIPELTDFLEKSWKEK